jgi:hypothetical protein
MRLRSLSLALALASTGLFAGGKTYQVTGPIMEIKGDVITVQKGKELWQLTIPAGTKGAEGLKVGDKVTLMYTMSVTSIEVKGDKKADKKADAPKADAKKDTKKKAA